MALCLRWVFAEFEDQSSIPISPKKNSVLSFKVEKMNYFTVSGIQIEKIFLTSWVIIGLNTNWEKIIS